MIMTLKVSIQDFFFYNLLTALQTVSDMYVQVNRAQSCANLVQHTLGAHHVQWRDSSAIDRVEMPYSLELCVSSLVCMVRVIYVYVDTVFGFYWFFFFFHCLVGCFSMIVWAPAVLSVLYACVLHFCIGTCSAQLSMFHMERHSRSTLIIIDYLNGWNHYLMKDCLGGHVVRHLPWEESHKEWSSLSSVKSFQWF